jgi:hypothetical protein
MFSLASLIFGLPNGLSFSCIRALTHRQNKSWSRYEASSGTRFRNTLLCVLMGALWCGGNALYGIGVNLVGDVGTVSCDLHVEYNLAMVTFLG